MMKQTKAAIFQQALERQRYLVKQARSRVALERQRYLISEEKKKQRDYLDRSIKIEQAASTSEHETL